MLFMGVERPQFKRVLDLSALLKQKSHFLFGPRGTGKTTLIRSTFNNKSYMYINLLHHETHLRLLQNPSDLRRMIGTQTFRAIIIDEIQKIPELLDEIHDLIETEKWVFLLTGSSARKLKRMGANLLAGRARVARFFPLVYPELPTLDLHKRLHLGGLPAVWTSSEPWSDLRAYVDTYLKEEIEQEAQVRQLGQFSRFLVSAAMTHGELLNYAGVASDAQVPESTVRGYYQILSDTLLGSLVEPLRESKKRKAIQTAKFFFFDSGIVHAITHLKDLQRHSHSFGKALEHLIFSELSAYLAYRRIDEPLRFWRSIHDQEVDFVVGREWGIEVKATNRISNKDFSGIKALQEEKWVKRYFLVSQEPHDHEVNGTRCFSVKSFLEHLWADKLV
jgi:predicted AAA+ superfamily ATPase